MKRSFFLNLLAPLVLAGSLNAASDYLLEIDGIKGESSDAARPGTIEIESFSWGATRTPAASGGGAGKVSFSDINLTTLASKATPQLLVTCAGGTHIPKATLFVRKGGTDRLEYMVITLENILVSSLNQNGTGSGSTSGASRPTETFSLNFEKVTFSHTADDGTVTTGTAVRTPLN